MRMSFANKVTLGLCRDRLSRLDRDYFPSRASLPVVFARDRSTKLIDVLMALKSEKLNGPKQEVCALLAIKVTGD